MADPSLEVRPDFESNAYRAVCEALMLVHNEEVATAIERLSTAWEDDHHARVEAWNLQREVEDQEAECIHQERRQREEEQRQLEEAEAEKERRDAEKKKPKINDFNENRPPPSIIVPRPSQYALQKILTFDFIELWYFSPEGCSEASQVNKSQADDTLGITNANDVLTLCPIASIRASRNACADHELAFGEFMQAKNSFLYHIKEAPWPPKHVDALAEFFWNLENHPMCVSENGDLIALHYASRIRRCWHDDLKNNTGSAFNISLISDTLMNNIAFKLNSNIQAKVTRKVSN